MKSINKKKQIRKGMNDWMNDWKNKRYQGMQAIIVGVHKKMYINISNKQTQIQVKNKYKYKQ